LIITKKPVRQQGSLKLDHKNNIIHDSLKIDHCFNNYCNHIAQITFLIIIKQNTIINKTRPVIQVYGCGTRLILVKGKFGVHDAYNYKNELVCNRLLDGHLHHKVIKILRKNNESKNSFYSNSLNVGIFGAKIKV
jgi:hypothetical protein